MNDNEKLKAILNIIVNDEELATQFAQAMGETPDEFRDWAATVWWKINTTQPIL